jgi:hypothetical protein
MHAYQLFRGTTDGAPGLVLGIPMRFSGKFRENSAFKIK